MSCGPMHIKAMVIFQFINIIKNSQNWTQDILVVSSVQLLSRVQLFATPWTTARQASLSITNTRSPPKPMSIESVMPSNHLILCRPVLLPLQPFPASGAFPKSQFFAPGGQSIGISASVLPMNSQNWLSVGQTGLLWFWKPIDVSNSLQPHGLQHARLPCPSPTPGAY